MDLLSALIAGVPPTEEDVKRKIEANRKRKKATLPDLPRKAPRPPIYRPQIVEAVTMVSITRCANCATDYEYPTYAGTPTFLRWQMNRGATRFTLTPCHHPIPDLPHRIERTTHTTSHCHNCYNEAAQPDSTLTPWPVIPNHSHAPQAPCSLETTLPPRPPRPRGCFATSKTDTENFQ